MSEREFWSDDDQFGLKINENLIKNLLETCLQSLPNETGGIIIGFYNSRLDCAIVTTFTTPSEDSKFGRNWFYRGIKGLQLQLNQLWHNHKNYYLGEWHFHPFSSPNPSPQDMIQMYEIAATPIYKCPEALLLILGGDPSAKWSIRVYVFQHLKEFIELIEK